MSNTALVLGVVLGLVVDGVVVACIILVEDACVDGYVYVVAANAGLTIPSMARTVITPEVMILFINF
jgi:hypothetical protein